MTLIPQAEAIVARRCACVCALRMTIAPSSGASPWVSAKATSSTACLGPTARATIPGRSRAAPRLAGTTTGVRRATASNTAPGTCSCEAPAAWVASSAAQRRSARAACAGSSGRSRVRPTVRRGEQAREPAVVAGARQQGDPVLARRGRGRRAGVARRGLRQRGGPAPGPTLERPGHRRIGDEDGVEAPEQRRGERGDAGRVAQPRGARDRALLRGVGDVLGAGLAGLDEQQVDGALGQRRDALRLPRRDHGGARAEAASQPGAGEQRDPHVAQGRHVWEHRRAWRPSTSSSPGSR